MQQERNTLPTPIQRVLNSAAFWLGLVLTMVWLFNTIIPDPRHSPPPRSAPTRTINARAPQQQVPRVTPATERQTSGSTTQASQPNPADNVELGPVAGWIVHTAIGAIGCTLLLMGFFYFKLWQRPLQEAERDAERYPLHPSRRKPDTSRWGRAQAVASRYMVAPLELVLMALIPATLFLVACLIGSSHVYIGALYVQGPCAAVAGCALMGFMYFPAAAFDKQREQELRDE